MNNTLAYSLILTDLNAATKVRLFWRWHPRCRFYLYGF